MLKRVLLILALIFVGCSSEEDTPHEMNYPLEPVEGTGGQLLPGTSLPPLYSQAYEITEQEWLFADMAYSAECVRRKKNIRLILAGWDDFEIACGGEPYSRHITEMHDSHPSTLGCTLFDPNIGQQLITIDAGMVESRKLGTMMHEAIHTLGSCSADFSDGQHADDYRWDFILPKARARVTCNSATLSDLVETRSEPYCILGKFP